MNGAFRLYLVQRFRPVVFGPAIAGTAAAAVWAAGAPSPGPAFIRAAALTFALVLQFRLWDDLEDRDRDRLSHPERVLTQRAPGPFILAAALAAVMAGVMAAAWGGPAAAAAFLALEAAGLAAYRLVRNRVSEPAWESVVLLAKYPAMLAVVTLSAGGVVAWRLPAAMALAYAVAVIYEHAHTRTHAQREVSHDVQRVGR
jgi:hypothetical protein